MLLKDEITEKHGFAYITDFDESKKQLVSNNELNMIKNVALLFREKFLESVYATVVHQFICSRAPYPTRYGFHAAYEGLNPLLYFNNKATLVQFKKDGKTKNLLFNPYFPELSINAGFFSNLAEKFSFIPKKWVLKQ